MNRLGIIWRKEMRESWKNRKWIWLPLVFILLGAMQPISTHFMPQILKMSGGLPAGTVIHIPTPSPASVFAKAQSQYNSLGLLVLVLGFMGSISNERQQGVLELVMVKPVSHGSYIAAKWGSAVTLTVVALAFGDLAAWYYTVQLIGPLAFSHIMVSTLLYALWLILIVTLTILFSVLFNSSIANAFVTLLIAAVLSVLAGLLKWKWSPGALPAHATFVITQWKVSGGPGFVDSGIDIVWSLILTVVVIAALVVSAAVGFKRKTFT